MKLKNLFVALSIFLFASQSLFSQNTYVPDDNFEQALIDWGYDSGPLNDSVPTANIESVTELTVYKKNIKSLKGIEGFIALKKLTCSWNNLDSLNLELNKELVELYCHSNNLTVLDLSHNLKLEILFCISNQITELNLELNTALKELNCSDNKLTSLELTSNTSLTTLGCIDNQLSKLDLTHNKQLKVLGCGQNLFTNLDLSNNSNLLRLQCDNNPLATLDLSANHALISLSCYSANLTQLDISANSLLTHLNVHDNKLTTIDLTSNYSLESLNCSNNQFVEIDVSNNVHLKSLECNNNKLKSLNIANNDLLSFLHFYDNQIPFINLDSQIRLTNLSCSNNLLTELNISKNIALRWLNCQSNKLSNVDLKNNQELIEFNCSDNQLSNLDVSLNNNLTLLDCSFNQIKKLNLNTCLENISCKSNHLSFFDISSVNTIKSVDCSHNQLIQLNISNGNNAQISSFNCIGNLNLSCIQVDNTSFAEGKETWNKDEQASYSQKCSNTIGDNIFIPDDNFEQALIDLGYDNELNDSVSLTTIQNISVLNISGKNISILTGLEKFTNLIQLDCSNNELTFSDILPILDFSHFSNFSQNFIYHPQGKVGESATIFKNKEDSFYVKIESKFISSDTEYKWFKEGVELSGQTDSFLYIPNLKQEDQGTYNYMLTNINLPKLALHSNAINLYIKEVKGAGIPLAEYIALKEIYNSSNGQNWTNNTNWLDTINYAVDDWYGVKVENGHVKHIILNNNNLNHSVFTTPAYLPELTILDIGRNRLIDINPENLESFSKLDTLVIIENNFNFSDITPIFSLNNFTSFSDNFNYSPQNQFGKEEFFHLPASSSVEFKFGGLIHSYGNIYQWYKNNAKLVNTNDTVLRLSSISVEDSALYHLEITNQNVPNLVLKSANKVLSVYHVGAGIPLSEYKALEAFYNSTAGENWNNNRNWLDTTNFYVSQWSNIQVRNGHVVNILMDTNNVSGVLPEEILDLKYLEGINLVNNNLTGKIPEGINQLTKLKYLSLGGNKLSGNIPKSLGQLNSLIYLGLRNNNLTGTIPSEIGNCSLLQLISLNNNDLTGEIPVSLGNLNVLRFLNLSYNSLTGTIPPEIGNLTELRTLNLNNNSLEGPIPAELENLTKVYRLDIDNNLFGTINPDKKSATLKGASAGNNRQIPDALAALLQMDTLYLGGNNLQFNDIEAIFSWNNYASFEDFIYYPQGLIGTEKNVEKMENEAVIITIDNYFPGSSDKYQWYKDGKPITGENNSQLQLTNLELTDEGNYYCRITNTVATKLILTSRTFRLEVNEKIAGAGIPLSEYLALEEIYSTCNGENWNNNNNWLDTVNFEVNDWYGITVENGQIVSVNLQNNQLRGIIPSDIGSIPGLKSLKLNNNKIYGPLPKNLQLLKQLNTLNLESNYLGLNIHTGDIDSIRHISDELAEIDSLKFLNLKNNFLMFRDIEPIFFWNNFNQFESFIYNPQQPSLSSTEILIQLNKNVIITLEDYLMANNNEYQWYKNDEIIPDETGSSLQIQSVQFADEGEYYCAIKNTIADEMQIKCGNTIVKIYKVNNAGVPSDEHGRLAGLAEKYNINLENWLDTVYHSVSDWNGITVENGHVTGIDLSGQNLSGSISPEFTQFDSLTHLDLSNNNLSGPIPSFTGNQNTLVKSNEYDEIQLEYLNITNNNFIFSDMEAIADELGTINEFIYWPQAMIGAPLDTSVLKYESITFDLKNYLPGTFDSYTWKKDGAVIEGTKKLTHSIENAALQDSGFYTCTVTNSLFPGLSLYSDTIRLKVLIPSGTDNLTSGEIRLYPNPAGDQIYIETQNQKVNLKIYNLTGNLIQEKKGCTSGWINLEEFAPGIYLYRISGKKSEVIKKVIIN